MSMMNRQKKNIEDMQYSKKIKKIKHGKIYECVQRKMHSFMFFPLIFEKIRSENLNQIKSSECAFFILCFYVSCIENT
jgi:hypothetical protein